MEENIQTGIVPTNVNYNYHILKNNLESLQKTYPFLEIGVIGYSVLGKEIPFVKIGNGSKKILYQGGIHANEWITSVLLMKFIENFSRAYLTDSTIYGYDAKKLCKQVTLYIIPMMNPDGIDLVTGNVDRNSNIYKNYVSIARNFPQIQFSTGWKANFNGVDLNLQFPAGWNEARRIKFQQGYNRPAPRDFVGEGPLTEPESLALYNFTIMHKFELTISYHTQGKEIYWNFQNINPPKGYEIGQRFAEVSGYTLEIVPYNSSFAGYKDWFIQDFNKPSYTVEAGFGENPLPITQFEQIYLDNEGILVLGMVVLY